ncbi:cytochrome P450 [Halovivax limisalsi]|uniref:cytochrome P450 n=1 Tax=Halovivax limisalsi TaxID=1453760 RepID=UPI001FFC6F9B|nr:cytochrome P450 [Halovivax limisalsi]
MARGTPARGPERPPTPPGLPVIGNTVGFATDSFGFIEEAVATTGDVVRIRLLGRDVYGLAHPDHVETALLDRETFAKLEGFEVAFGESVLATEGEQWHRQRHAMEDFFTPRRIGEHAETMTRVATERADRWAAGTTIDADEAMRGVALENLFEVILGQSLTPAEIDDLAAAASALNLYFKPTSWALPEWVPTPARRRFDRRSGDLRDAARRLLADEGPDPDPDSLLARLSTLRDDPDSAFDASEVLDQVVGMLFAGHETTALSMTYALHAIGSNPAVADRFYDELDETLGERLDGTPTPSDLDELPYLERIVDETLRWVPPVHTIPRVTTEPVEVGGYEIPADAEVLCSVWNVHRDSRFYDEPERFDPDRWADTTPRERGYAYVPFGAGPRICIGRHFARLEMKATLATLGRRFAFDAVGDLAFDPQMTTQPDGPVRIRLRER